jgi:hydroxyacylglutathione hydrolase
MENQIKTISLPLPLGMGRVNCYLIQSEMGYLLVDTGGSNNRKVLTRELEQAGVKPGLLKLIVITHGDFDHMGSAAHLRRAFESQIAMHAEELGTAEQGDMFASRKKPNAILRALARFLSLFGKKGRFSPDILLSDGQSLAEYGLVGRVVSIPGHSRGSIGLLLESGDFFCGDLLTSMGGKPALNSLMDDVPTGKASLDKMRGMGITKVYPGHGKAFKLEELKE